MSTLAGSITAPGIALCSEFEKALLDWNPVVATGRGTSVYSDADDLESLSAESFLDRPTDFETCCSAMWFKRRREKQIR